MPTPHMDVLYVGHSNSPEMTPTTPGEQLTAELIRLGVEKTELAARLKVKYPTILRWTKDRGGFTYANRVSAAQALGLAPNHFERPDLAAEHEKKCAKALAIFLASPFASNITDAEKACLATFKPPVGPYPATPLFYAGALNLIRGLLPSEEFEKELKLNDDLARSVTEKFEEELRSAEKSDAPKRTRGGSKSLKGHKPHR